MICNKAFLLKPELNLVINFTTSNGANVVKLFLGHGIDAQEAPYPSVTLTSLRNHKANKISNEQQIEPACLQNSSCPSDSCRDCACGHLSFEK